MLSSAALNPLCAPLEPANFPTNTPRIVTTNRQDNFTNMASDRGGIEWSPSEISGMWLNFACWSASGRAQQHALISTGGPSWSISDASALHGAKVMGGIRVTVIEQQAFARVQTRNGLHLDFREFKVEYVEVLGHAFTPHRPGNDHHAALNQPSQRHLGYYLAVRLHDVAQGQIGKKLFLPSAKGSTRLDLYA